MPFQLKSMLSEMKAFYNESTTTDRFTEYLAKLQGTTEDDLAVPIMGFNPMAKAHISPKIDALLDLNAEQIMEEAIQDFNETYHDWFKDKTIEVVLNLADDVKGGWTERCTTDFDSKFKINGLVNRQFCTPYFWASEAYSAAIIKTRTVAYLCRTFFWLLHPKPSTLEQHFAQEQFVAINLKNFNVEFDISDMEQVERFYKKYKYTDDYALIFNFFYGDSASEALGYKPYGITTTTGYDYAAFLATQDSE